MRIKVFPPYGCCRDAIDEQGWLDVPEGTSVRDVLKIIKCSRLRAKLLMVSINGTRADFDAELKDGDVLGFFSLITGG